MVVCNFWETGEEKDPGFHIGHSVRQPLPRKLPRIAESERDFGGCGGTG